MAYLGIPPPSTKPGALNGFELEMTRESHFALLEIGGRIIFFYKFEEIYGS